MRQYQMPFDAVVAQIGVTEAERVLCTSEVNLGQLIVMTLLLISVYFIAKSFVRVFNSEMQGGLYSFIAGLVPLFIPALLVLIGVDTGCLLPL